jgi:hypothetical protein
MKGCFVVESCHLSISLNHFSGRTGLSPVVAVPWPAPWFRKAAEAAFDVGHRYRREGLENDLPENTGKASVAA